MASGGHGFGHHGGGGAAGGGYGNSAATAAWDSLSHLDVLREVYSSLSFPGIVPDAGMAPGGSSRDGLGGGLDAAAAGGGYPPQYHHDEGSNMGPPPLPAAAGPDDDSYAAMDEDGPPSQQRQAYRDRKRRLGGGGGGGAPPQQLEEEEEEEEEEGESGGSDAGQLPEGSTEDDEEGDGRDTPRSGKGKGLFLPPRPPSSNSRRGGSGSNNSRSRAGRAPSPARSETSVSASGGGRRRRRAALKAEAMLQEQAAAGAVGQEEEGSVEGGSEEGGGEDSEEEAIDMALMALQLPAQFETDFVGAVFRLGLKCSSPKVLMEHMPRTESLTTEHIKSHLQKYRLHSNRSKDEFIEYFNGYLRGPFAAFCARKGWEQRRDKAGDAAAFAAIPHHASFVAPGDRQHHMKQIQALTGQLLQGQLELQAQVQNYITSQISIQSELLTDVVQSSIRSLQEQQQAPAAEQPTGQGQQQPLILDGDAIPPAIHTPHLHAYPHDSYDSQGLSALAEEARALEGLERDEPSPPKTGKRRSANHRSSSSSHNHHHAHKSGPAGGGAITARLTPRGVTAI